LRRLKKSELQKYVLQETFSLPDEELDEYFRLTEFMFDSLESFAASPPALVSNIPALRDPGRRPTRDEDPYNAIVRWCTIRADVEGSLSGKRIGLKDNMAIAGVSLTCGSQVLQGYVPQVDSVVAERLLKAGAEIVAVTNMDNLAFSGGGDTSHYGPTLNPIDPTRTASGSSGGSAAALHYHGIDITFGTDQGGSIRLPAAWCGVLGLKPTFGLVPYAGIIGIDQSYDHVGPLARRAEDLAVALEAVAGSDESDPRQTGVVKDQYVEAVANAPDDLKGVTLGLLIEGFDTAVGTETSVAEATRTVIERMRELGAEVRDISVPEHLSAGGLAFVCFIEGTTATLSGFGNGYHWNGRYSEDLAIALGKGLKASGNELPPQLKLVLLLGNFLREHYFSTLYAKAQNLRATLRAAYNRALEEVDFLIMPTSTELPHEYVPQCSLSERVLRGETMVGNAAVFDMTGHPALSMPAAQADGLPVGVQVVGRMFSDAQVLGLARAYEKSCAWFPPVEADRESESSKSESLAGFIGETARKTDQRVI
jgi:amidase